VQRIMTPDLQADITEGAYWLRKPGPNAEVIVAYTGAVAPEAIEATGFIGESRRDIGLLAITSVDRLHSGWTAARQLRRAPEGLLAGLRQPRVAADAAQQPPGVGRPRRPLRRRLCSFQRLVQVPALVQPARVQEQLHGGRTVTRKV